MKSASALLLLTLLGGSAFTAFAQQPKEPVDYVSPNIGGIGQLLTATIPYVQRPHGMARIAPITTPGITDRYLADKIYGFPAGPAILMASVGDANTNAATYASDFDHDFETATPYYYEVDLQSWSIRAELTAASQSAYYRFTFPASSHAHLVLSLRNSAELTVIGNNTVEGSARIEGPISKISDAEQETREYFYIEFSRPFDSYQTWEKTDLRQSPKQTGDRIGFVTNSQSSAGEAIEARVGIS